nr:unnamed protein product [Callosobruchus chinensis]
MSQQKMADDEKSPKNSSDKVKQEDGKHSLVTLKKAEPSENISIVKSLEGKSEEVLEKVHDTEPSLEKVYDGKMSDKDTVESKMALEKHQESDKQEGTRQGVVSSRSLDPGSLATVGEHPSPNTLEKRLKVGSERIVRNESDIFSLKEQTSVESSIFSVNGSPSRKVVIYKRRGVSPSKIFPFDKTHNEPSETVAKSLDRVNDSKEYCDLKRPSSSIRNPLTGTGLNSNDEYKFKGNKRRDGNPLLGVGYSPEAMPSAQRIPPGGYAHKLW